MAVRVWTTVGDRIGCIMLTRDIPRCRRAGPGIWSAAVAALGGGVLEVTEMSLSPLMQEALHRQARSAWGRKRYQPEHA